MSFNTSLAFGKAPPTTPALLSLGLQTRCKVGDGYAGEPQTVQDVRQGAANNTSGTFAAGLGSECFFDQLMQTRLIRNADKTFQDVAVFVDQKSGWGELHITECFGIAAIGI